MFIIKTRPEWGFLVGAGAVGIPATALVVFTEGRASGWAWMAAFTATLVGGGWAAILSLRRHRATLARATLLGSYAWLATTFVFSIPFYFFYLSPALLWALPISALLGAAMGAIVGGLMKSAGIRVRAHG